VVSHPAQSWSQRQQQRRTQRLRRSKAHQLHRLSPSANCHHSAVSKAVAAGGSDLREASTEQGAEEAPSPRKRLEREIQGVFGGTLRSEVNTCVGACLGASESALLTRPFVCPPLLTRHVCSTYTTYVRPLSLSFSFFLAPPHTHTSLSLAGRLFVLRASLGPTGTV
jgi:hypothetical protein